MSRPIRTLSHYVDDELIDDMVLYCLQELVEDRSPQQFGPVSVWTKLPIVRSDTPGALGDKEVHGICRCQHEMLVEWVDQSGLPIQDPRVPSTPEVTTLHFRFLYLNTVAFKDPVEGANFCHLDEEWFVPVRFGVCPSCYRGLWFRLSPITDYDEFYSKIEFPMDWAEMTLVPDLDDVSNAYVDTGDPYSEFPEEEDDADYELPQETIPNLTVHDLLPPDSAELLVSNPWQVNFMENQIREANDPNNVQSLEMNVRRIAAMYQLNSHDMTGLRPSPESIVPTELPY